MKEGVTGEESSQQTIPAMTAAARLTEMHNEKQNPKDQRKPIIQADPM